MQTITIFGSDTLNTLKAPTVSTISGYSDVVITAQFDVMEMNLTPSFEIEENQAVNGSLSCSKTLRYKWLIKGKPLKMPQTLIHTEDYLPANLLACFKKKYQYLRFDTVFQKPDGEALGNSFDTATQCYTCILSEFTLGESSLKEFNFTLTGVYTY